MLKDKVLIIYVTRDNPVLLKHSFDSFKKHDAGYDHDFLIVDHESSDPKHLAVLDKLSKEHKIVTYNNNRVEVSFNKGYQEHKDYKYYFFLHDDSAALKDGWLKVFVDRMQSDYCEDIIKDMHFSKLPIGRVGAAHQYWRSYSTILGYPVQCVFLEHVLKLFYLDHEIPKMFKFADPDRVLISNECISAVNGITNIDDFKQMKESDQEQYRKLCEVLNRYLPYHDEGIPPRNLYPEGECWNKITMTTEFLNSVAPLIKGYRTVGIGHDGYLEQIHGNDVPIGNEYVAHYGQPNVVEFLARKFQTDGKEIRKQFNNKVFLMKADKLIKEYFERRK